MAQYQEIPTIEFMASMLAEDIDDGREYLNDPVEGPERVRAIWAHNPNILIWVPAEGTWTPTGNCRCCGAALGTQAHRESACPKCQSEERRGNRS